MSEGADFVAMMEPVARLLFGDPNKALSSGKKLRFGNRGSLAVDTEKGVWHRHGEDVGGGVLDLIKAERGLEGRDAIAWLREQGFTIPDRDGPRPNGASKGAGGRMSIAATYPYTDEKGDLLFEVCRMEPKDFRQRRRARPDDPPERVKNGWVWSIKDCRQVPYRLPDLIEAVKAGMTVFVCYTPDTEVLTRSGWVRFDELEEGSEVAQWNDLSETISFAVPSAYQRFAYEGDLVHLESKWCDLLVTPDHRQPARTPKARRIAPGEFYKRVHRASQIRQMHQLPVAGCFWPRDAKPGSPTPCEARLIAAWLADGVEASRGQQVSWNLKKRRKQERLRALLLSVGATWTEHDYPSNPGWVEFRVYRDQIAFVWAAAPAKRWEWSALSWGHLARAALLDEVGFWDGDRVGVRGTRFFTSDRQSADVVCAIATLTGRHGAVRVDSRVGRNDSYVVNINDRSWRILTKTPRRVGYAGEVFCCTVPDGFLVVRRNGKVTISGNCEGEKDVENLKKIGVPATCNAAGAGKWPAGLEPFFQDADVVLLPDNDPQATNKDGDPRFHPDGRPIFVGQDHMEMVGGRLGNVARNVRVIELPKLPIKGDVSDWIEAGGTADALYDLVETAEDFPDWVMRRPGPGVVDPNAPFQSKFHAVRWQDLDAPAEEHEWLIKNVLTRGEVGIMAGPSQSGKSFLGVDVAMAIARGVPWFGQRVLRGGVVYQAGEGRRGLLKRLRAYRIEHDVSLDDPVPFVLLPSPIDLYASDDHTNALIVEIKHWAATFDVPLELVVIDTLAAATSGADENSGKDMGPVLARCARVSIECRCSVLLVHHMNAGGQKARGWTGITANVDSVIAVAKLETEKGQPLIDVDKRLIREWHLTKQKDGEDGLRRRFVLPSVETGRDRHNEPVTSCVVRIPNDDGEPGETQRPTDTGLRLTPQQDLFLRAVYQARDEHGEEAPAALRLPRGVRVVRWSFVTQTFAAIGFEAEQETDPKKKADKVAQAAKRAGERLMQLRIIMREKPYVWLTEKKVRGFGRADRRETPREPDDRPPPPDEDPYDGGLL